MHVVNISTPGEPVEYTLTAPSLAPENDVDLVDDDGNESNQDVIRGNSAAGFIGNGNYDAYAFTGSIDAVRLESDDIADLDVTIDGESVDPRSLTGEETHEINVSAPGEDVEYTLTAPDLEPTDDVEVGENAEGAANPDTVSGDTASGTIGNGAHDTYRFTGSVDAVRLESANVADLDVTVDGEPVDPRSLTDGGAGTTETTTEPTTETTTESTTETTDAATATTAGPESTAATTTAASGAGSGQSGFGMVMFVLIGIVSGLVLAGALVYVVRSDRSG